MGLLCWIWITLKLGVYILSQWCYIAHFMAQNAMIHVDKLVIVLILKFYPQEYNTSNKYDIYRANLSETSMFIRTGIVLYLHTKLMGPLQNILWGGWGLSYPSGRWILIYHTFFFQFDFILLWHVVNMMLKIVMHDSLTIFIISIYAEKICLISYILYAWHYNKNDLFSLDVHKI